ncbi:MAG TPA: hypothetical protein VGE37_16220, partial [Archangium sp.]
MRLAFVLALFTLFASCSAPTERCEATCAGCCDASGTCQAGTGPLACGAQGRVCQACPAGAQCFLGQCTASTTGGGTGSTGGGGGATGGGGGATGGGGGTTGGGGGSSMTCAGTLLPCGTDCRDLDADDSNCGRCGNACTGGTVCTRGTCQLLPMDCSQTACPRGYGCDPQTLRCVAGCRVTPDCPSGATCTA